MYILNKAFSTLIPGAVVQNCKALGGGCINEAALVQTNKGIFFAKWNDAKKYTGMLEAEVKGLRLLIQAGEIKIPDIITQAGLDGKQYLILEYIESGRQVSGFWNEFGRSLARLHKHTSGRFGLDHNNYIGSLPQSNKQHATWPEFFVAERLEPQLKMARDTGKSGPSLMKKFDRLFVQIEKIFPAEKPSLLHGDLWSGNFMTGPGGEPVLIDPAVYYGHREMDLGMTQLFGGFPAEFYEAYQNEFPMEKGWEERLDICNLYPLLVHVNLFGGNYAIQAEGILNSF